MQFAPYPYIIYRGVQRHIKNVLTMLPNPLVQPNYREYLRIDGSFVVNIQSMRILNKRSQRLLGDRQAGESG